MNSVRVALVGLGTVGQGVVELLRRHAELYASRCGRRVEVVAALVRDTKRPREFPMPPGALVTSDADAFMRVPSDIVVEVAGGTEAGRAIVARSLESGRDAVTANKAMLAVHAPALFTLAEKHRRRLRFEAAVAGGVPVIELVTNCLASNRISSFAGVLNGTCNFILTRMAAGGGYDDALAEAQRRGFAEADPTLDVTGRDSLEKLAILASLAFGAPVAPDKAMTDGITNLTADDLRDAARRGYTIKLLACASINERGLDLWNGPTLVPIDSPLGRVGGADMGLLIRGDATNHIFICGDGAGRFPTASAVVADVLQCARLIDTRPAGPLNPWPIAIAEPRYAPYMETLDTGKRGALIRTWT